MVRSLGGGTPGARTLLNYLGIPNRVSWRRWLKSLMLALLPTLGVALLSVLLLPRAAGELGDWEPAVLLVLAFVQVLMAHLYDNRQVRWRHGPSPGSRGVEACWYLCTPRFDAAVWTHMALLVLIQVSFWHLGQSTTAYLQTTVVIYLMWTNLIAAEWGPQLSTVALTVSGIDDDARHYRWDDIDRFINSGKTIFLVVHGRRETLQLPEGRINLAEVTAYMNNYLYRPDERAMIPRGHQVDVSRYS